MKPGYKTTEFWLSAAAQVVSAILASGAVSGPAWLQLLGVAGTILNALGYTVTRGSVKKAEALTSAAIKTAELGK